MSVVGFCSQMGVARVSDGMGVPRYLTDIR